LAVVAGMKKPHDHAEPTKVKRQKNTHKKKLILLHLPQGASSPRTYVW